MKNDVYKPAPEPVWSFDDLGDIAVAAILFFGLPILIARFWGLLA